MGEIIVMQEPLFKTYKIDGKPVSEIILTTANWFVSLRRNIPAPS